MFSSLKNPLYPHLPIGSNLFFKPKADEKLINFNQLVKLIDHAEDHKDSDQALQLAQKLAIYFGPPGLIHYINVSMNHLRKEKENGEEVQQQGFNILVNLLLTKKILESDETAEKLMTELMPHEKIDSLYWKDKISTIIDMAELEGLEENAERCSINLFNDIKPDISSHRSSCP